MNDFTLIFPHLILAGMVLARLTGLFIYAPILSSPILPRVVKVFLVFSLTLAIYPSVFPNFQSNGSFDVDWTVWNIVPALGYELIMGLILGYIAMIPMMGIQLAGHEIGQQFGMAIASEADPNLDSNSSVVGIILFYMALMVFLNLGGHRVLFVVMLDSFRHVPLGSYRVDSTILETMVGMIQTSYELAIRIAAPILCLMLLQAVSLGFVSRTAPSFNILSLGFPLRVLVGMCGMIGALSVVNESITNVLYDMLQGLLHLFSNGVPGPAGAL